MTKMSNSRTMVFTIFCFPILNCMTKLCLKYIIYQTITVHYLSWSVALLRVLIDTGSIAQQVEVFSFVLLVYFASGLEQGINQQLCYTIQIWFTKQNSQLFKNLPNRVYFLYKWEKWYSLKFKLMIKIDLLIILNNHWPNFHQIS